jgi:hypothetical protein
VVVTQSDDERGQSSVQKQSRGVGVPERSADFAHLPLVGLRQYRRALTQEESRVSYWRRILQARLDMVRASESAPATVETLRPVLTEARVSGGRRALVEVVPMDDIPPLPNLEALWDRDVVPGDDAHNDELVRDLVRAEAQLSAYRAALHRRLSAATTELIARYREDPSQCLSALPLPPERSLRSASGA